MYELLKARRSIRKFQDKQVEKEKLDTILKCALLAMPSSRRSQPWEFVAVTDRELLQKLSTCREHGAEFLAGAPAAVVVLADLEKSDVWIEDAVIAAIIMQLAAQSLGLGYAGFRSGRGLLLPAHRRKNISEISCTYRAGSKSSASSGLVTRRKKSRPMLKPGCCCKSSTITAINCRGKGGKRGAPPSDKRV
ncbi:MAG: nitroreductase family protein [Candidatus Syntrophopropionicum ammoniitolerans]